MMINDDYYVAMFVDDYGIYDIYDIWDIMGYHVISDLHDMSFECA